MSTFPITRHRRLRQTPAIRHWVGETKLSLESIIAPLFIKEALSKSKEIPSMPGQRQWPVKEAVTEAKKIFQSGIPAVILFGIPDTKDPFAQQAARPDGFMQKTIHTLKKQCPSLIVIADVCLCEYTDHGHCGLVKKGKILNDPTLSVLSRIALSYAQSGADIIAPSDMMDGRIKVIRQSLDQKGFEEILILSYAVKYASSFYGPFRQAAENPPSFGDRATYQMDPANAREALREVQSDLKEGADLILIKPALSYGDIIHRVASTFHCPVGCYNVSGEYAMVKAAAQKHWIDEKKIVMEQLLSFKRSGAQFIITYWAKDLTRWIKKS